MTRQPRFTAEQLPVRWALILLAAATAGMVVGTLTFMQTGSWPAALLAALGAAGASIPVLHKILGK